MTEGHNYLSGAIRHYSSLFTFPSYPVLLTSMFAIVATITASAFLATSYTVDNILRGIIFGLEVLLLPTVCADLMTSRLLRGGILNLRRLTAFSTVTTSAWALVIAAGAAAQAATGLLGLVRSTFLGASLIMGFRFLVVRSLASFRPRGSLVVVFLSPSLSLTVATSLWWLSPSFFLVSATIVSSLLLVLVGEYLIQILNKHGEKSVGVGALRLFRGFICDWLEGAADPLEECLEEIAVPANASVNLLVFTRGVETLGLIVVSDIHPGPFKNIGSSNIPFEIQTTLEGKTMALVVVPHGASGHERDLPSTRHRERLINSLTEAVGFNNFTTAATPMVRCDSGDIHASCQFFGDIAFVTLTCAPQSMEDIPFEFGVEIVEMGKALGAEDVVVIDAHNSIGEADEVPVLLPEQLRDLRAAAESAIGAALRASRTGFKFGASRLVPKGFGLREGMGPGGIAVAAVEAQGQRVAYVTLDGNNMVRGLREEIREALKDLVNDSEILVTDTHAVNAITTIERGYHPIGEVGNREELIAYIRRCTTEALSRLEESRSAHRRINIPDVLVIGEEKLKGLSLLVDSSITLLKRLTVLVYGPAVVLTTLMFLLS